MKNKNQLTNQQMKLNLEFVEYCQKSDLVSIKNLCDKSLEVFQKPKPKMAAFLKMLNLPVPVKMEPPIIDFFSENCAGIITLANKGDINALSYIISTPLFTQQFKNAKDSDKCRFADAFFNAADLGHMNCAQLLSPLVKDINLVFEIFNRFVTACRNGNLNMVKFLTTTNLLDHNANYMINTKYSEFRPHAEGFVSACEAGHLNVVKYLTSDKNLKERINLDFIDEPMYVTDRAIVEYFFFEVKADDRFLRLVAEYDLFDELKEKRDLIEELSYELETNTEQPNKKVNKI